MPGLHGAAPADPVRVDEAPHPDLGTHRAHGLYAVETKTSFYRERTALMSPGLLHSLSTGLPALRRANALGDRDR